MALPKALRLTITKENRLLLRTKGKTIHTPLFTAFYLPSEKAGGLRGFGVVLSNAIAKKATVRNRLRRYIHEAIRQTDTKSISIAMIIYTKKKIAEVDTGSIRKEIIYLLRQI